MSKLPMYIIVSLGMGIGGYLPVLLGQSMLGGWSVLGTLIGGFIGIWVFYKLRQAGYLD